MAGRTGRPVARPSAFWDASALVPLCVCQPRTTLAIGLYESHEVIVWWATPVEIASALARLVRMKQLEPGDWAEARRLAKNLADSWSVIQPSDALRRRAAELVDDYDLRAADALQLAAALAWCEDEPQDRVFLTLDQKLRKAALLCGFDAKRM